MPKGKGSEYLEKLGQAGCTVLLQQMLTVPFPENIKDVALRGTIRYSKDEQTGCWLWRGRTLPEGYIQFKKDGVNYMLHRIAYVAQHGLDITGTASHLCFRPNCFNPDHIVDESMQKNNARKGCTGDVFCPRGHQLLTCLHEPKCIPPPRLDARCCLDSLGELGAEDNAPLTLPSSPPLPPLFFSSNTQQETVQQHTVLASSSRGFASEVLPRAVSESNRLIEQVVNTDVSQLSGSELMSGPSSIDDFVVGDDVIEYETEEDDPMDSDF